MFTWADNVFLKIERNMIITKMTISNTIKIEM